MSGYWQESRNAYAMSNFFPGFATNIYRPVDVDAPPANFFTGGKMDQPLRTSKSILSSYAIADTVALDEGRWLITAGARHQSMKVFGYDYNSGVQNAAYDESAVSPAAGIVFKPVTGVSVYANYIEGLQQGPVASGTDIDNVGETFAPYTSRQKELGVKFDTGALAFSAAVFTTGMPSAYIQDRHFGVFGEQRNRGVELSIFGNPMRGVRLLGGLTLLDAEQRRTAGAINQGKDVIGVPQTQLNIGGEWDINAVAGLSLNARAVYTSKQYADGANTQQLPSWNRIDLGVNYLARIGERNVTFRARLDNAFDRNYWASAGGYPGAGYLVAGAPRSMTVSATVDF
jgi:iron complex outermembrane recepter protein